MILQVSRQADYSIQLVRRLARLKSTERLSLTVFSRESNISFLFLQKIARRLKQAGLIASAKGMHGGYFLLADPRILSLKDIVEAMEGKVGVVDCVRDPGSCAKADDCSTKSLWEKMNQEMVQILAKTPVL